MRSFLTPKTIAGYTALVALVAVSACSDTTSPTSLRTAGAASHDLGSIPDTKTNHIALASHPATSKLCASQASNMALPFPTGVPALLADVSCGNSFSLEASLETTYNPGWAAPLGTSEWIGPTANSNFYTLAPGFYKFSETFHLPANATAPIINVSTLSDNLVAVYLNGVLLGSQTVQDCVTAPCNWQNAFLTNLAANFNINADNTLSIMLVDTPIGLGKATGSQGLPTTSPLYNCQQDGPQQFGRIGFSGSFNVPTPQYAQYHATPATWDYHTCLNPGGLDYVATVGYNTTSTTWCSPGFWKNHEELWTAYWNVKYSALKGLTGVTPAAFGNKAPAGGDPTIKTVIENPQIYGGPATNSVADYLSHIAFGTPIGSGIESCPNPQDSRFPLVGTT